MNKFVLSRRHFLQTAAFAGAAGMTWALPGVSYSAGHKTLTVRFDREMESLDPGYYVGGHPPNDVNWCIMPALVHYGYKDGQAVWVPSPYVESVVVTDATHIDFTLKQGLQWSGGNGEVTTEDVAYSYDRMAESEWKGDYLAYERVDIKDAYSGTIVLNQPFSPFMTTTLASGTGIILCKKAMEAAGGKYTLDVPATCGPYVMEHKQAQYVKLRPNPDWTGPEPAYENIDCLFVTEAEAGALAFEAGELDCTKITSNAYARYQKETPPNSMLTVAGRCSTCGSASAPSIPSSRTSGCARPSSTRSTRARSSRAPTRARRSLPTASFPRAWSDDGWRPATPTTRRRRRRCSKRRGSRG